MTLTSLTFFSEPGIYEIETAGGPVYDVDVPEDLTDAAVLLVSKEAGKADSREGRKLAKVLEFAAQVGQPAYFLLKEGEDFKEVQTKPVTVISRVG